MAAGRGEPQDSVALVYGLARTAYRDQFAQRDQQRTRCGTLLAFAGNLATLSTSAARDAHGSILIFVGIIALIATAGLFFAGIVWFSLEITPRFWKLADEYLLSSRRDTELQILGNTVGVIRRNERTLQRADSLFGVGGVSGHGSRCYYSRRRHAQECQEEAQRREPR